MGALFLDLTGKQGEINFGFGEDFKYGFKGQY
jgi:hypothetical protein